MADISSRKLKTLLIATAIVAVTSFSIGLLRLNAFSLKGPKGGKDSERKKSLPSEQSGPNSSEVNNDSIDEKSLEKDAEVSHDPVVKSLAGPSSSQVAESKSYAEAAHAQNNISSDEVISTTFLETGMMPQPQIHNPSKVPKIAINLDHPFDSEYSNTFYEDSDGEICLVDSLLIPQPVPFDTILLQAFPHQHTFQDHSSLNKNEEKRLRFSEGILGPVQTPKKDNIKKQTEHELFASSNDKNKDFNPTKIPLSSNNNITLLNNMDTLLNESKHAPSLPPTLLEEDLENLEKVDQLETESCPTIQKNMQSSNLEISDEKEGDVKCTSPAAKPLKPTSFNVLANEFIPSSYNIPQQQYHFDNDYESSMYQQVYQQQGENWNPYMSQGKICYTFSC